MEKSRKSLIAGGMLACLVGTGFLTLYGRDVPLEQKPDLHLIPIQKTQLDQAASKPEPLEPESDTDTAVIIPLAVSEELEAGKNATLSFNKVALAGVTAVPVLTRLLPDEATPPMVTQIRSNIMPAAPNDPLTPQLGCSVVAQAEGIQAGMARLTVVAPCYKKERVTIHHNGMIFAEVMDERGTLSMAVPVLNQYAIFVLAFANGEGAVAQAHVPELADFDRVAVQWSGFGGLQIHAREYGALYGELGHVWSGSTRTSMNAIIGDGGFVARLGDPDTLSPQVVEVYTFPTKAAADPGTVELSIETEVTSNNCGRDVSAQVLSLRANGTLQARDLILSVPDCSAIGDFLVLNNLVDNLKIAEM